MRRAEALGLAQVDLLGFSIGGFVAQAIALIRPALVRRLILAATGPKGAPGMQAWGGEFLARFMARTEDRDAATILAARRAVRRDRRMGILDHGALQRLTGVRPPRSSSRATATR